MPWDKQKAQSFIVALSKRGLMTSTLRVYLRRVRALHLEAGLTPLWTSADVRQLLKGTANSYRPAPGSPTRDRVPVTPFILYKIKEKLSKDSTMSISDKRMFWLFCTWAYVGSFRSSDILAEQVGGYRPTSTLMTHHVTWRTEIINNKSVSYLVVRVPEPKEAAESNSAVLVELLPLPPGTFYCPVQAFRKWSSLQGGLTPGGPLFVNGGRLLTGARVNLCLRNLLKDVVDYTKQQVLGHSFRSGVISALARVGASKEVMMSQGRWNSEAFEVGPSLTLDNNIIT